MRNACIKMAMSPPHEPITFVSRQVESSRLFFLEECEGEDFHVVFGGFERCQKDYRIDRQDIPWYCLEFVSSGRGGLTLRGVEYDLQPGCFYIYGPGFPHRIESSPDHPMGKYFVGFTGAGVKPFFERYGIEAGMMARCIKSEAVRRAFDMLIERGVRKSKFAGPLCTLITRELLLLCRDDAATPVDTGSSAFALYTKVRKFLETRFLEVRTLEAVAVGCGLEAPYLCRLFARYHDESPYQYLTRLRMDHASQLLLEPDASVRSVSEAMGFKDPFHFSRVFKSIHHVPPSRFRQSMHPQRPG